MEYQGYKIKIKLDKDPEDPRSNIEPVSTMVCWHSRHNLGDMERVHRNDFQPISKNYSEPIDLLYELADISREEYQDSHEGNDISFAELYQTIENKGHVLKILYLYDHSGLAISSSSWNGRAQHAEWDSGPVGFIYMTKDKMEENGWTKEKAAEVLDSEVETYDAWLQGEVYGFQIEDSEGNEKDACWGFYGDPEKSGCITEAKEQVDYLKTHPD